MSNDNTLKSAQFMRSRCAIIIQILTPSKLFQSGKNDNLTISIGRISPSLVPIIYKHTWEKIYLAGPLFTEAEQACLRGLKHELQQEGFEVIWPYELFNQEEIASWGEDAAKRIMEACKNALDECNLVVALLDGTQVDDGTAWELGYAYAKGIPAVGIRTDARYGGECLGGRINAMLAGSMAVCLSRAELLERLIETCRS